MVFNVDCSNRAFDAPRRPARRHPRAHGPPRGADRPQPRRALRQGARAPPARARGRRDLARRRPGHPVRHQPADQGGRRRGPGGAGAAPRATAASPSAAAAPSRATTPGRSRTTIPLTSIYSRGDGVVWWEACVVPYARNVEVTGSHVGLAFNRKAYRASRRSPRRRASSPPIGAGLGASRGMHSGHIGSRPAACLASARGDHHALDLVGALVDLQHLRVAHHPLGREVLEVAVAAEHLHRLGGDAHRRVGGLHLRHRGELGQPRVVLVDRGRGLEGQRPRGGDVGLHVGELELHALVVDQRLAERLAAGRVVDARGRSRPGRGRPPARRPSGASGRRSPSRSGSRRPRGRSGSPAGTSTSSKRGAPSCQPGMPIVRSGSEETPSACPSTRNALMPLAPSSPVRANTT